MSRTVAVRGEFVDVGGRRLRAVLAGPSHARPLIVCEHGAFGCATDWTEVQTRLAARGHRSVAYDRAGLGFSDPGPPPRDAHALRADLAALLGALGEPGPYVLVAHSMGGLMARVFALAHPGDVAGLVLVDAMTPDMLDLPGGLTAVHGFGQLLRIASVGAHVGMMEPVSWMSSSLIGLTGEPAAEKRRIHARASHAQGAAEEVGNWRAISVLAASAELEPDLPVATLTAGAAQPWNLIKQRQEKPALRSRFGYVEHVRGCNHASLLGPDHADAILRGIDHVLHARPREI